MNEAFLYYIWQFQLYNQNLLTTLDGKTVQVLHPGYRNTASGPDFSEARIKIGDTEWAGNVEIHVHAKDWYLHKHQNDAAFNTVILHVIAEGESDVELENKQTIPTLTLQNRIPKVLLENFKTLQQPKEFIPCERSIQSVSTFYIESWLETLVYQRLERKSTEWLELAENLKNDWNQVAFIAVARAMGFKLNAEPFRQLASNLPFQIILKNANNPHTITALVFGLAGFLEDDFNDIYFQSLKSEFQFYSKKYKLSSISKSQWKFGGARPYNFPTIRLAQTAAILSKSATFLQQCIEAQKVEDLINLFSVNPDFYWQTHMTFGKESKRDYSCLSENSIQLLLINAIIPAVFAFGIFKGDEDLKEKAINWLSAIDAESNSIVTNWKKVGIPAKFATQSQSLIELKSQYCDKFKCLNCVIGNQILRSSYGK